jgi:hypothetical protein
MRSCYYIGSYQFYGTGNRKIIQDHINNVYTTRYIEKVTGTEYAEIVFLELVDLRFWTSSGGLVQRFSDLN